MILRGTISDAGDLLTKIIGSGPGRFLFLIGEPTSQDIGVVPSKGASASILDEYVPVGSAQLTVSNPTLFHPGQEVQIQRTLTKAWIRALGMDKLVRDGKKQTWLKSGTITYETRAIQSVDKRIIHLDVPLTDSINATFGNDAKVVAWEPPPDRPQSVGLESLIVSPESDQSSAPVSARDDLLGLVIFTGYAEDCWTRNIRASGFSHAVSVEKTARRITIANILMIRPSPTDTTAGSPADILITGSRVLVYQCSTTGVQRSRSWNVATGTLAAGPNAVVQYVSTRPEHIIEPHQRFHIRIEIRVPG